MESNLKSCAQNSVIGKVEASLDTLHENVYRFGKLSNEVIELIQSPKTMTCSPDVQQGICGPDIKPTLSQQIDRLADRVDDSNQRLTLAIDILRQNLGEIKLD